MSHDPAALTLRRSRTTQIILVLMIAALLAGCGKKGNPTPPADQQNTYPQVYPKH
jgi:predicted small lipoprotein YifL